MGIEIEIIGGGLAGLTLGIGLRRQGVPVVIHEAGYYPRHKVCGEFISGEGLRTLERLELKSALLDAGARVARTAAFFSEANDPLFFELPEPALALSRYSLDALLAKIFESRNGILRTGTRLSNLEESTPGRVLANGRQPEPTEGGFRWIGLKIHAQSLQLLADLEMHFFSDGYVGLCKIEENRVNLCALVRSRPNEPLPKEWLEWLLNRSAISFQKRMEKADWISNSATAVAGLSLKPRPLDLMDRCAIGDSLTMIAPVTGNGMSMALESADLAVEPLVGFSEGKSNWEDARREIAQRSRERFERRLAWAWRLQRVLFQPTFRKGLLLATRSFPRLFQRLYSATR